MLRQAQHEREVRVSTNGGKVTQAFPPTVTRMGQDPAVLNRPSLIFHTLTHNFIFLDRRF